MISNITQLALVVPCYNEEEVLEDTFFKLNTLMKDLIYKNLISKDSFILYVDDGSTDSTWASLLKEVKNNLLAKGLKISRNRGHQNALLAGMKYVENKCDCLISIDADLQQDENVIKDFLDKFSNGAEVVLGIRNNRKSDGFLKKYTALLFYNLMQLMGVDIVKNHADYRLLSNRCNCAVLQHEEVNLFLRGLIPLIGFKTEYVYFNVKKRLAGESKYTLLKMLSFAIDGITSFSVTPLRFISFIGFIVFLLSFIMGIYVFLIGVFSNEVTPGWASTVLPIYFLGGIQILSLGIVGEYIGKIYKEVKRRPKYFIEQEV